MRQLCVLFLLSLTVVGTSGPSACAQLPLRFDEHLVMDGYTYSFGIATADLDGDGDLDITSADALPNNDLYWFENDGQGRFQKHFIQMDDPERLERHGIGDIDGDGHLDVVIVKNLIGDLLWFKNSGKPADGKLWKRHVIANRKIPGAYDVALGDYDGDGDLDVAASTWRLSNNFVWFENDGTPAHGQWKMRLIDQLTTETRMIRAADIDDDKDLDLVGTARQAPLVVWYENNKNGAQIEWKKHVIDKTSLEPLHGQIVDMDADGDLDLVMSLGMTYTGNPSAEQVVWYENNGQPAQGIWKKHLIADGYTGSFEACAADIDGDKDVDVVATAWGKDGKVAWFENTGAPSQNWKQHTIKNDWPRANAVRIADLDGDERPDIVAGAERGANEVRWWRNAGPRETLEIGSRRQTFPDAHKAQTAIELMLVDDQAIAYATFQSHNQKVVANDQSVFITYVRQANADYTGQLWRLARSEDGGRSFVTVLEETRATSAPALETDQRDRLFFGHPDFRSGNAYLSRLDSLNVQPVTTTLVGGSAGKYCMALDERRRQICYFAHNGTFHVVGVDGKVLQTTQLLTHGKRAVLMYPHLTLGRNGTLYAAWTTEQRGKYLYRSIHTMKSTDGGASWRTLDGMPLQPPIVADDEGPSTHVTRDDELDVHSWLSAFMAKDDKLHLVYWAETSPERQRYLRFEGVTGKKEVDVARIFCEREMSEPNDSGVFVANRSMRGSPLYFVSTIDDRKRLACLVSRDNGRTWSEFAISDQMFENRIYSIGAARDVTHDGWIVGIFTDVVDGAETYFEPNSGRVYFFRIRAL